MLTMTVDAKVEFRTQQDDGCVVAVLLLNGKEYDMGTIHIQLAGKEEVFQAFRDFTYSAVPTAVNIIMFGGSANVKNIVSVFGDTPEEVEAKAKAAMKMLAERN